MFSKQWIIIYLLCTFSVSAVAAIRPGFSSRDVGWHATDIIVASETKEPGKFKVFETWKGSLSFGSVIEVPGMAEWQAKNMRLATVSPFDDDSKVFMATKQLVLFLDRRDFPPDFKNVRWRPATFWGGDPWEASFAWLQDGKAYGYRQIFSRGSSMLMEIDDLEKMHTEVMESSSERDAFDRVIALPDPTERANALLPFLHAKSGSARPAAIDAIKKCGKAALPVLQTALTQNEFLPWHPSLLRTMAAIGGIDVGPDLVQYLEGQTRFWGEISPPSSDWGPCVAESSSTLRDHYAATVTTMEALEQIHYQQAALVVDHMCQIWSKTWAMSYVSSCSSPPDQMTSACGLASESFDQSVEK